MKAAIIEDHGSTDIIRLVDDFPDPVAGAGDVVIRVRACALNYHDIFTRRGMPGIKIPMPCIMGIDMAGEIVQVGPDTQGWSVGDRILVDPLDRVGWTGLIGEMSHGGLAEYCRVPAHQLIRLPDAISFNDAACLPVAYGTAHRMINTIGQVRAGERVLVLGASGGVGTGCVQLANALGAEVIACASSAEKLQRLKQLGARHELNYSDVQIHDWVREHFGKPHRRAQDGGVDVVVNFTGGSTWVPSLRSLRRQGRLLTCGATAGFDPREDLRYIWTFELNIRGSNGWQRDDILSLLSLVEAGKLTPVIDRVLPLTQVHDAFAAIESRSFIGKILVAP